MRSVLTVAVKDLAQRTRDRSIFIIGIVAPLALAAVFNLVFGGGINDVGDNITFDMGVVDDDPGPLSDVFTEILTSIESDGLIELTTYPDEATARAAVEDGDVGAAFLLDSSLSADITSGADATIEVVGNVDASTTTQVASSIAEQFAIDVRRGNTGAVASLMAGTTTPDQVEAAAAEAAQATPALTVGDIPAATRQLDSSTYFVAGLSLFFLFFIAGMAVTSLLDERRNGTLARLLAAPISPASIVAGKSLTSVVVGLVAMSILVVASTLLMGADWGPVPGVAMLVVTAVLAVIAIMSAVGSLARTAEQAGNLQSIVAVTLGMLGGTFVQISSDGLLGRLSLITPNAWFIRGLGDMVGGGSVDAIPAAAVLLVMAAVAGLATLALVRRTVRL
ncbi:MAG: ABC transporter permease [Acidimicrobiales bacterium]